MSFNFVIHALAIKVFFYYWQSRVKLIRSAAGGLSECFFQGKVCFLVGIFSLRGKYCHGSELVCAWKSISLKSHFQMGEPGEGGGENDKQSSQTKSKSQTDSKSSFAKYESKFESQIRGELPDSTPNI